VLAGARHEMLLRAERFTAQLGAAGAPLPLPAP
jgi:hypothetical protein